MYVALVAAISWPQGAQATPAGAIWVSGAEIQDFRFEAKSQFHAEFSTTTKHSGNAAFVLHSGTTSGRGTVSTPTWGSPVTNGTVYLSAWVNLGSNMCPLGCTNTAIMIAATTTGSVASFNYDSSTGSLTLVKIGGAQIGGAYALTPNVWHLLEMRIGIDGDSTADDVLEARIDGAVRSNQTTSSVDTGTAPVNSITFLSPNITTRIGDDMFVDDIIVTSDAYVGLDGHVILRTADGTGHYGAGSTVVAFNGCNSYATCWSHNPPDDHPTGVTYATDGTGNYPKFLATIGDFSSGTDAVLDIDTVLGCRSTWSIAKSAGGSNRSWEVVRRIEQTGAETIMPPTGALDLSTTFSRFDDLECTLTNCGPWGYCATPPCTTTLDSIQLGGFRNNAAQARLEEIGDVYVSCAYRRTPSLMLQQLSGDLDLGWTPSSHNQTLVEGLANRIGLFNCTGTTPTTCDLFKPTTGDILSVTPQVSGGIPICVVTTITGDFGGSITYTGTVSSVDALTITLPQKLDVYGGNSSPSPPCPTCSGANLGDSGTCQGGANNGHACVVDGTYGTFGNTSGSCLPGTGIIATMIPDVSSSSTGSHTLPADETCTGANAIGTCHCVGQQYANSCGNGICDADELCNDDGTTACFPDPIVRVGSTSPLEVTAIGCVPATNTGAVNSIVGLPGPIAITYDLQVSPSP